jgi:RimJ/RimL family protein N-acetyltransferase
MNLAAHVHYNGTEPVGIETTRFRLRLFNASDESLYCNLYCSPDTMKYVGPPLSAAEATRSFRAAVKQSADPNSPVRFLAVIDKATEAKLGICGVQHGVPGLGSAEVGMMLKGDARGLGYSREVLAGVLNQVFESPAVEQVWVRYAVENTAMDCLARRSGFAIRPNSSPDGSNEHWIFASVRRKRADIRSINQQGVMPCPM